MTNVIILKERRVLNSRSRQNVFVRSLVEAYVFLSVVGLPVSFRQVIRLKIAPDFLEDKTTAYRYLNNIFSQANAGEYEIKVSIAQGKREQIDELVVISEINTHNQDRKCYMPSNLADFRILHARCMDRYTALYVKPDNPLANKALIINSEQMKFFYSK